jgi:glycosyltransferase involved in cell wall biosynthesis
MLPVAFRRGGVKVLFPGEGRFIDAVKRSAWCMEKVIENVRGVLEEEEYDFSLSIGTILPGLYSDRPNFIYTDMTILANHFYPGGRGQVELWEECLPYEQNNLEQAALVFTMSDHITRSLIEHYGLPPEKVRRVNGGCNVAPPSNSEPERFFRQRVLFIGMDWERKGGPEVLEAFRQVRRRCPRATLLIVGCAPPVKEPGVEVIGPVSQEKVSEFLAGSTVFCMPSKREPFGIAYLEAMAAGLPVIASNLGAAPDFIIEGENGYTVDPGNIRQLAFRMEQLISNPRQAHDMGRNARFLIETQYTWKRTQAAMWKAIQEYLKSGVDSEVINSPGPDGLGRVACHVAGSNL